MTENWGDIGTAETRPFDVWFDIPGATDLATVALTMYDISDNTKADLVSTKVAGYNVNGDEVRVALTGAGIGTTYYLKIEATDDNGDVHTAERLITCTLSQVSTTKIPPLTKKSYTVEYSDDLPSGVDLASMSYSAYEEDDSGTDVSSTVVAGTRIDGQDCILTLENGSAGDVYVITLTGTSAVDAVTSVAYVIVKTLVVECK